MWILNNETPFAAERTWTRDEEGVEHWLVAIKASFQILPDRQQVPLQEQVPVSRVPVFAGDPSTTELIEEADFNFDKLRTDVLVAGHAYAPDRRPAQESMVRLKVAEIDKSVRVIGNRVYVPGGISVTATRPDLFLSVPLSWHRSYGGTDTRGRRPAWEASNPVGVGFATDPSHLVGQSAPNFERLRGGPRVPAGFGPIARHWAPRVNYAGTYGEEWKNTRDPLLPRDFNRLFFQCAPEDQQTQRPLVGYEHVQLVNFTAERLLEFLLPRITFDIITQFYGRPDRRQKAAIHTLLLRPDERRFVIVWHSALACPYDEERLRGTVIRVKPRINVPPSISRTGVWVA